MAYHRQQGVDTAIVRIFNTYGPRMRPHDGRAIPTFLRQALQDRPITVFGDGSQTRSFCYVERRDRRPHRGWPSPASTTRSTSAIRTSSRCSSWPRPWSRSPGSKSGDRVRGAADRRPAGPPARHLAGARAAAMGARGRASARAWSARSNRRASSCWSAIPPARTLGSRLRGADRGGKRRYPSSTANRYTALGPCRDDDHKSRSDRRRGRRRRSRSSCPSAMCGASGRRCSRSCCAGRPRGGSGGSSIAAGPRLRRRQPSRSSPR